MAEKEYLKTTRHNFILLFNNSSWRARSGIRNIPNALDSGLRRNGAKWYFSSAENRNLFAAEPER
mgnify:CR=1 FL=1